MKPSKTKIAKLFSDNPAAMLFFFKDITYAVFKRYDLKPYHLKVLVGVHILPLWGRTEYPIGTRSKDLLDTGLFAVDGFVSAGLRRLREAGLIYIVERVKSSKIYNLTDKGIEVLNFVAECMYKVSTEPKERKKPIL